MTKGKMIILHPDGDKSVVDIRTTPSLGRLQRAVRGYIQEVPLFDTIEIDGEPVKCLALCNEDGKIHGMRTNQQATDAWLAALQANGNTPMLTDELVGPVVVLTGKEIIKAA